MDDKKLQVTRLLAKAEAKRQRQSKALTETEAEILILEEKLKSLK